MEGREGCKQIYSKISMSVRLGSEMKKFQEHTQSVRRWEVEGLQQTVKSVQIARRGQGAREEGFKHRRGRAKKAVNVKATEAKPHIVEYLSL